jgi:hypothetical protein
MTGTELKVLYEKLYFQEVEARDKLTARLQIPLSLILAIIGAAVFLLQNFDYQSGGWTTARRLFMFFLGAGGIILVMAIRWFVNALYDNEYHFLPHSVKTAEYKALLEETYKDYEQRKALVSDALDKYITDYYVQYAAFNTQVNDRRSAFIHLCNGAIMAATVLFVAAFFAFYFGDLDKSRIRSATEVLVTKPVEVRVLDSRKQDHVRQEAVVSAAATAATTRSGGQGRCGASSAVTAS